MENFPPLGTADMTPSVSRALLGAEQVGNEDENSDIADAENDEDEDDDGTSAGAVAAVVDMAKGTFEGHSDAVYCVAVNPTMPSQVSFVIPAVPSVLT